MSVETDFKGTKIGFEILFIFIAGCSGDIILHLLIDATKNFKSYKIAEGLIPYYKSIEHGSSNFAKKFSSYFNGAVYGGFACVIALMLLKLFLFLLEETNPSVITY
jgi:hypothetical protein